MGHTLQECFIFKDKLQELINKSTVELNADVRTVTTNVVFVDKDLIDFMNPQEQR